MRLTEERRQRGWSRAELARRAGMNATTVGLVEAGRFIPYPSQLAKLARALGIPEAQAGALLEPAPNLPVTRPSTEARAPGKDHSASAAR